MLLAARVPQLHNYDDNYIGNKTSFGTDTIVNKMTLQLVQSVVRQLQVRTNSAGNPTKQ